jgi:hypothetical protein
VLCGFQIAALQQRKPAGRMCFREIGGQLQSPATGGICGLEESGISTPVHVQERTAVGDTGVRQGVAGVDLNGPFEHLPRVVETLATELVEELATAQIELVRLHVLRRRFHQSGALILAHHHA